MEQQAQLRKGENMFDCSNVSVIIALKLVTADAIEIPFSLNVIDVCICSEIAASAFEMNP